MSAEEQQIGDPGTLDIRPGDVIDLRRSYCKTGRRIRVLTVENDGPDLGYVWVTGQYVSKSSNVTHHKTVTRALRPGDFFRLVRRDGEATPGTKAGAELAVDDHVKIGGLLATVTETSQYTGAPNVLVKGHRTNGRYFVAIVHPTQRITLRERSAQA